MDRPFLGEQDIFEGISDKYGSSMAVCNFKATTLYINMGADYKITDINYKAKDFSL